MKQSPSAAINSTPRNALRNSRLFAYAMQAVARAGAKLGLFMTLGSLALFGQTVTLTNLTRGGGSLFYVGDEWQFYIQGAPNAAVSYEYSPGGTPTPVGTTNSSGYLIITGYIYEGSEGCYDEIWTVGGSVASPDPVAFCVYPQNESTCGLSTTGVTTIFNVDVWINPDGDWDGYYQNSPYVGAYVGASSTNWCTIKSSSEYDQKTSISGNMTQNSGVVVQWWLFDNGDRPGLIVDGSDPGWYYPYEDTAALAFGAINLTNGAWSWGTAELVLIVDYTGIYQ
jgi:hypothetical protein